MLTLLGGCGDDYERARDIEACMRDNAGADTDFGERIEEAGRIVILYADKPTRRQSALVEKCV